MKPPSMRRSRFLGLKWPVTARQRSEAVIGSLVLHVHPAKVGRHVLDWRRTLGLGWICLVLFAVLVVTGVILMFYYVPHPPEAYRSMKDLAHVVTFGSFLRNMHRWAAHGMVFFVVLHLCRVFYTGSYKQRRRLNWCVGVFLLLCTLALSFTGYLLPWDQLAFWAITVGTTLASYLPLLGDAFLYLLRGGNIIGEATLVRFYVLHCVLVPTVVASLVAFHMWRVRKDGGLSHPGEEEAPEPARVVAREAVPPGTKTYGLMAVSRGRMPEMSQKPEDCVLTWPHLLYRELLLALFVIDVLCVAGILFNAPLEALADPTNTPNPAKAPWYFLGLQELVHYSAFLGGVVAPGVFVTALLAIPFIDKNPHGVGVWFHPSRKLAVTIFTVVMVLVTALTVIGTFFRGPNWGWVVPW